MDNYDYKILLPYMSNMLKANICLDEEVLFYCGYALFSNDVEELKYIYKIISSKIFWYYIRKTSKPYSGGYMSFAKNYIKDFSLPNLDDEIKKRILEEVYLFAFASIFVPSINIFSNSISLSSPNLIIN